MESSDFKCFKHCVKEVVAVVVMLSVGRDFMIKLITHVARISRYSLGSPYFVCYINR